MQLGLTFNDVLLVPKFSSIRSRKDVILDNGYSKLPILSANMDSVTGPEMAKTMLANGGLGCLHRFWSIEDNVLALQKGVYKGLLPWVSVGVGEQEFKRAEALFEHGARMFVLDVAHGASQHVVDQYKRLKDALPDAHLTVGNFATAESIYGFERALGYKPDMVKVGIGPGSACTTRIKTGVGFPQLSAILDCGKMDIPLIADGGCKTSGDIAKSLACKNVKMVMLGGMLAGTDESPGEVIVKRVSANNNRWLDTTVEALFKTYRGSASKESYADQGKDWAAAEGETFQVNYKGPVREVLLDIEASLQSSFSYVGGNNLKEFQERAEFVQITGNGYIEGTPHGKI